MNSRRKFLKQIGMVSGALLLADSILAEPYKPIYLEKTNRDIVRVKGIVTDESNPIEMVVISDGINVVATGKDGTYELITDTNQSYIFISQPAGYKISVNSSGTANFYQKITTTTSNEIIINFRLEKSDSDIEHSFLLLADPQTLDLNDINRFNNETISEINNLYTKNLPQNIFAVSCGDIMYDNLELFPEYEKAIAKTRIPFYQVLGNHDVDRLNKTDEKSHITFQNYFGPRYYSFNRGDIHYVVLDSIFWFGRYIGYFDQAQLDWLKQDLSFIEKGKTVVVFCHIPPNNFNSERNEIKTGNERVTVLNRELLYDILVDYKSLIITGHMHESEFISEGGTQIHVCGAVCGAWWSDNICYDGTPNGYMVYSAKGSELSWQYKSTGLDLSHQMTTNLTANNDGTKNLIANVWGVNKDGKVFWYKDGIKKGALERFTGFDPVAEKLFSGNDKPAKHKWVDPTKTDHLFRLNNLSNTDNILVEYVDEFGRTYTKKF
ncbi:MAG: calcineurin-like phosphoesterase family protein [Ignavibacteriaceae bacterium]